jgi:hypothetical protein
MNKNKKYEVEQIMYTDNLLKLIGFNNIADYETTIYTGDIPQNIIMSINNTMDNFRTTFPTKSFNLSKINYILQTPTQLFSFVKNCLDHINQPHELIRINNKTYMRLKPHNKILTYYINMNYCSDIGHNVEPDIGHGNIKEHYRTEETYKNAQFTKQQDGTYMEVEFVKITEQKNLYRHNRLHILTHITDIKCITLENLPNNYIYELYYGSIKIANSRPIHYTSDSPFCMESNDTNKQQFNFSQCTLESDIQKMIYNELYKCIHINSPYNLHIDIVNKNPNDNFHIYNCQTNKFLYDCYDITITDKYDKEHKLKLYPNDTYFPLDLYLLVDNIKLDDCVDIYINGKFICNNNVVDFVDNVYDEFVECDSNKNNVVSKFFAEFGVTKRWIYYNDRKTNVIFVSRNKKIFNCVVTYNNAKIKLYENGKVNTEGWRYSN